MNDVTLESFDLDLPELDHALVVGHAIGILDAETVLKRDLAAREFGILRAIDRLLAIENHGEGRSLGDDLERIPFTAGMRHRINFGDVDDRARAVARIRPRIP